MYETDSIPEDWVAPASCDVDQVWVPSAFNKRTFMAAGVPEDRLRVLHEAVDTVSVLTPRPQKQKHKGVAAGVSEEDRGRVRGEATGPVSAPWLDRGASRDGHAAGGRGQDGRAGEEGGGGGRHVLGRCEGEEGEWDATFRILSVFKWETRKGWDVLLRSYWAAFSPHDKVCLYLRAKMDATNRRQLARLGREMRAARCGPEGAGGTTRGSGRARGRAVGAASWRRL